MGGSEMFLGLGQALQNCGYSLLLHDRRNTGSSDIGYAAGHATEAELQANDLQLLLERLGLGPAVLVGNSSGGRLSLLVARRHPSSVRALVLMNLTGGEVAARNLGHLYYSRYISVAQSMGGMERVACTDHYAQLCKANPRNVSRLQTLRPKDFVEAMCVSAEWLESTGSDPVLGHTKSQLAAVMHSAKVVFTMHNARCPMHTLKASQNLNAALPGAQGVVAEWKTLRELVGGILCFLDGLGASQGWEPLQSPT